MVVVFVRVTRELLSDPIDFVRTHSCIRSSQGINRELKRISRNHKFIQKFCNGIHSSSDKRREKLRNLTRSYLGSFGVTNCHLEHHNPGFIGLL